MVVFGTLYAATETLFPTHALDFVGGIGKATIATGAVVKLGRGAEEITDVARAESRLVSEQRELASVTRWTRREAQLAPLFPSLVVVFRRGVSIQPIQTFNRLADVLHGWVA